MNIDQSKRSAVRLAVTVCGKLGSSILPITPAGITPENYFRQALSENQFTITSSSRFFTIWHLRSFNYWAHVTFSEGSVLGPSAGRGKMMCDTYNDFKVSLKMF